MRVTHVLTDLEVGGAQLMAARLVESRGPDVDASVLALRGGPLAARFREAGIRVDVADFGSVVGLPVAIGRLRRLVRSHRPDVLQTWMYHGDFFGSLVGGATPVVWNIRQSAIRSAHLKRSTRYLARACAIVSSRVPAAIVCCSEEALASHAAFGYDRRRMRVIENGIDVRRFAPDPTAPDALRTELSLPLDAMLIGQAARLDPEKDLATFLRSFQIAGRAQPRLHAVLAGPGMTDDELPSHLRSLVDDRVHLVGVRPDIERVLAGLDVYVSSSLSEGFPNSLAEAMSAGVPCVGTDAGASSRLVGGTGTIVAVGDAEALAAGIVDLLRDPERRRALGAAARDRIASEFGMATATNRYESLYREVVSSS